MRHLYISDLDGTLLGADSRVSARSAAIISSLTDRGMLFTVATARTPGTVQPLLADTRISLPAIVFTGAAEWDTARRRYTRATYLTDATADAIEATVRSVGITPIRYTLAPDGIIHAYFTGGRPTECEQRFIDGRNRLELKRMHVNDPSAPPFAENSTLMFFSMGPEEAIAKAASELRDRGDCSVSCYADPLYRGVSLLEVFAAGVSKASAVRQLADSIGADSITVFGDNLNDLPMMAVADRAVAVSNAAPEVLEAADIVIGPNTADSVALWLKENAE